MSPSSDPAKTDEKNRHRAARTPWPRRRKVVAAVIGAALAGGVAYAAANWVVGLATGSSSQAQSGAVQNITIVAVATPVPGNLLFPGGTGDVVAKITNPNNFPVTVTGVRLPANTVYATGYNDSGLATANTGCTATNSLVSFTDATATPDTAHAVTTPIIVAANANITVTFTNEAAMDISSPNACQNTFFKMPSFTGVTATAGAVSGATAPLSTNNWT